MHSIEFVFSLRLQSVFCSRLNLAVAYRYGQMNEPPGARARVALTGLAVAEYFRDDEGQDVLLFVDNIFRFTQACSEVCISFKLSQPPGYYTCQCVHPHHLDRLRPHLRWCTYVLCSSCMGK